MRAVTLVERLSEIGSEAYLDKDFALINDVRTLPFTQEGSDSFEDLAILTFVRGGYMHIHNNGEITRVSAGQLLLRRPGHHLSDPSYSEDFTGHAVILTMRYGQSITTVVGNIWNFLLSIDSAPVISLPVKLQPVLASYYTLMMEEGRRRDNIYQSLVMSSLLKGMLYSLVSDMKRVYQLDHGEVDRLIPTSYSGSTQTLALFNKFVGMLLDEPCAQRKIDHYAHRLCVTNKYLSSVCRRVSGRTAHQWITDAIVNGIEQQLRYTDRSIKEIAMHYGFTTLSFFSRYVKEHLGDSPSNLRKR